MKIRIGIVGDRDPSFRPHTATDEALRHAARALSVDVDAAWVRSRDGEPHPIIVAYVRAVAAFAARRSRS